MNKKQKIIVSIVGITIVLLALLGLTYAYYLTRIQGNTNTNSISVTTAKLELIYGDNSAEIIRGTGALMPTLETAADDAIGTKTFTVTNNGNDSSYVVIVDNISVTKATDGSVTTFVSNDFRYTLTCSVKDKSGNDVTTESCNDVESLSIFPINGGILVGNDIPENRVHEYTLTLWYIDTGLNQSDDMGKTYQARVNIADIAQMENPFKTGVTATDNASLAYNIIENAKQNKNGTKFVNTPPSKVAEEISSDNWELGVEENVYYDDEYVVGYADSEEALWRCYDGYEDEKTGEWLEDCSGVVEYENCDTAKEKYVFDGDIWDTFYVSDCDNGKIITGTAKYERVLSSTQDNYGTSYYFRGDVKDNYVTFSNKCWRIVRIQGDGSIKLTLESQSPCSENMKSDFSIGTANWGYKTENSNHIGDYKNDTTGMKNKLTTWLNETIEVDGVETRKNITMNAEKLLKTEEWCIGNITNTYSYNSPYSLLGTTVSENHAANTEFYFETGRNLSGKGVTPNATLKCNGEIDTSKIGALTADEVVYAGGKVESENYNFYLQNEEYHWWTLSQYYFYMAYDCEFYVNNDGNVTHDFDISTSTINVRPAVSLNANVKITSGEGTKENPYIIAE